MLHVKASRPRQPGAIGIRSAAGPWGSAAAPPSREHAGAPGTQLPSAGSCCPPTVPARKRPPPADPGPDRTGLRLLRPAGFQGFGPRCGSCGVPAAWTGPRCSSSGAPQLRGSQRPGQGNRGAAEVTPREIVIFMVY